MVYRIKIEEEMLIEKFGIDYLEYMKKTDPSYLLKIDLNQCMFDIKCESSYIAHRRIA